MSLYWIDEETELTGLDAVYAVSHIWVRALAAESIFIILAGGEGVTGVPPSFCAGAWSRAAAYRLEKMEIIQRTWKTNIQITQLLKGLVIATMYICVHVCTKAAV